MINSFEPIVNENCKIIILGTMPGVKSIQKQEYYGHERNCFWRIMYDLFNEELSNYYPDKKEFLLSHNIALWDVLKACSREGSSDSNIKNPVPNNFTELFRLYPRIKAVFFNGDPAQKLFDRYVLRTNAGIDLPRFRLPSTSPANTVKYCEKYDKWKEILDYLE